MKRFANPVPQFLKNNGDLASGGKLYFYQAGSDVTFKTIYSNDAGTTPLANPVTLTNEGRVTSIFGDGEYRVKFYDQNNVLQWSREYDFSEDSAQFEEWNSQISYSINDVSRGSNGNYYISQTNENLGNDPTNVSSSGDWSQIALLEVWNADKVGGYANDDVVIKDGRLYSSNTAANTTTPPGASWDDLSFNNAVTGGLTITTGDLVVSAGTYSDALGEISITKSAGKTVPTLRASTTTFSDDPDLIITGLKTGVSYEVRGQIRWNDSSGGAANGIKLTLSSGGLTTVGHVIFINNFSDLRAASTSTVAASFQSLLPGSDNVIQFSGKVTLSSGNSIALRWAQNVSSLTATTIEEGYIIATSIVQ